MLLNCDTFLHQRLNSVQRARCYNNWKMYWNRALCSQARIPNALALQFYFSSPSLLILLLPLRPSELIGPLLRSSPLSQHPKCHISSTSNGATGNLMLSCCEYFNLLRSLRAMRMCICLQFKGIIISMGALLA